MSAEFSERIRVYAGSKGVAIGGSELELLARYVALLDRWNKTVNLTALPLTGLPDRTIDRLVLEPLAAVPLVADEPLDWIDVGSGSGSPAIPLKIMRPRARLTMVESRARKAAFLREAIRTLELRSVTVEDRRLEDLDATGLVGDLLTVRGVRIDEVLTASLRRVIRASGTLLVFASASDGLDLQGFQRLDVKPLPGLGGQLIRLVRTAEA